MEKHEGKRMRRNSVSTQIRVSKDMYEYITKEATRLAVAKNAMIVMLIDEAIKARNQREIEPCSFS